MRKYGTGEPIESVDDSQVPDAPEPSQAPQDGAPAAEQAPAVDEPEGDR